MFGDFGKMMKVAANVKRRMPEMRAKLEQSEKRRSSGHQGGQHSSGEQVVLSGGIPWDADLALQSRAGPPPQALRVFDRDTSVVCMIPQ